MVNSKISFWFIVLLIISLLISFRYGWEKGATLMGIYIIIKLIKNLVQK